MPAVDAALDAEPALLAASKKGASGAEVLAAQTAMFEALAKIAGLEPAEPLSLTDWVDTVAQAGSARRDGALFVLRCLGVPNVVPDDRGTTGIHFQRKFVDLLQAAAPDICKFAKLEQQKITATKFDLLREIHHHCVAQLQFMHDLPEEPTEFVSRRQEVFKLISNQFLKSYLAPYDFAKLTNTIRQVLNEADSVFSTSDASFGSKLQDALDYVDEQLEKRSADHQTFLSPYALGFLSTARRVLLQIDRESSERFKSTLRPRRTSPYVLERRYPLHDVNRILQVKIPVVNDGPGYAVDATAQIINGSESVVVSSDILDIGTIAPGEFALVIDLLVGERSPEVSMMVELSWRTARSAEPLQTTFDVVIQAQRPDIDWESVGSLDPYSTEVAYGDEFVGRRAKVKALTARLLRPRMQCSYITGQKRVGKTSLAHAVEDMLKKADGDFETIYLEYGEYARSDAGGTVAALGRSIADALMRHLPAPWPENRLDFQGTIAPINQIAQALLLSHPNKKFVVILDEFDEIHPEMYRFGPLAEAFFSNLRTLSAKSNIALMLVGGENMPFIISAQGDQLNKFVREPLDYFSRSEEWEDFCDLARQRGEVPLNWHEAALTELFNYTNGHPYYTKLLCARVFQNALNDRDAEVTQDEVRRAALALVDALDTNAFAHFWKDGISAGREDAEVTELKRRRVLVAIARALRHGVRLTVETVTQQKAGASLVAAEIAPILSDFCRREILRERGQGYEFVLPLFEQWLVSTGITKLVADTLGDELSDAIALAEQEAFVTPPEIAALVDRWPPYRTRKIGAEDVRRWLGQRQSFRDQRLLFKLLQNLRFVSEEEIREKLRVAHSIVKRHTTAFTPENRSQRRFDIVVTYVDGPAKSGARYASRYAEENLISSACVIAPSGLEDAIRELEERRKFAISGLVIIDDIAASGESLSSNILAFVGSNRKFLSERNITIVVVAMLSTKASDAKVRETLSQLPGVDIDFRSCEVIDEKHIAFSRSPGIWSSTDEFDRSKALMSAIGRDVAKATPLGFGDLGLLVTFSETCPNNTLPVLHSSGSGWVPLFERPKN